MNDAIEVRVPRENTNDETVEIVAWLVEAGGLVEADQAIAEVETSKSMMQIVAPAAGRVEWKHQVGEEVAVGATICVIHQDAAPTEATPSPDNANVPVTASKILVPAPVGATEGQSDTRTRNGDAEDSQVRYSRRARTLIAKRELDTQQLPSHWGLVRECDVLAMLGESPGDANSPGGSPSSGPNRATGEPIPASASLSANSTSTSSITSTTPATTATETTGTAGVARLSKASGGAIVEGVPTRWNVLPRRKRMEGKYLRSGARAALTSRVVRSVGTRGLRAAAKAQDTIGGDLSAVILFEVSRLLRQWPELCAVHQDGAIVYYEEINIGFAVDAGQGLKVLVIHGADKKGLTEIAAEMRERIVEYMNDDLSLAALAGGTFTISDLSGEGAHDFWPLVNHGQSAILGVGAEFFPPGGEVGSFNLILTFDHQLTEGRAAAAFLDALTERLSGYEESWAAGRPRGKRELCCNRCLRTVEQLQKLDAVLVAAAIPPGHVCSVCLAGY